jgi:hypothetical protein
VKYNHEWKNVRGTVNMTPADVLTTAYTTTIMATMATSIGLPQQLHEAYNMAFSVFEAVRVRLTLQKVLTATWTQLSDRVFSLIDAGQMHFQRYP